MLLASLQLKNFRNVAEARLDFDPSFNLLLGRNAQGKTNIIEALSLLAVGRSFRTSEYRDLIRRGCDQADVGASARVAAGDDELRVRLDIGRKEFFKNGKKTLPGGFRGVCAVLFAPEEILLLRDSPSSRRRYLDDLLAQLVPHYRGTVRRYERVVSHRNRLLQELGEGRRVGADVLKTFDEQLVEEGALIVVERERLCRRINGLLPQKYATIAPGDGPARFHYRPQCGEEAAASGEDAVRAALERGIEERRGDERARGITLVGPHRDDVEARIEDASVRHYGSQGQHRTFVLALKIAEIDLLREELGETPLLLLDDVASELDLDRTRLFFESVSAARGQVFVTATDADDVRLTGAGGARRFLLDGGQVKG